MKKTVFPVIISIIMLLTSCAELLKTLETVSMVAPLTEGEVSEGLKEALITGARNSAQRLGATDGYFKDEAIKILLPEEANVIINNISKLPGGQKLVDDAILGINRAAEDAARDVAPIFISSVKQMTIQDAFSILNGENNAATQYLHRTTYDQLFNLYSPKIEASVRKPLVAGVSTQDSWEALTGKWNRFANSVAGKIAGFKPVETNLGDYLTHKALDGMFLKVEEEEFKIRKDVNARVSPILQRVFGSLDNK